MHISILFHDVLSSLYKYLPSPHKTTQLLPPILPDIKLQDTAMSNLTIQRASSLTEAQISHCDFSFTTSSKIHPITQLATDQPLTTVPIPELVKDFGFDAEDFEDLDGTTKVLFTLQKSDDKRIYGYVLAQKGWNEMVHVEYICLDKSVRGAGSGAKLLEAVESWTREIGLTGIRCEGQSNNVAANLFYKKSGFVFGGYDEYLYRAIPKTKDETAVFWYKMLAP